MFEISDVWIYCIINLIYVSQGDCCVHKNMNFEKYTEYQIQTQKSEIFDPYNLII